MNIVPKYQLGAGLNFVSWAPVEKAVGDVNEQSPDSSSTKKDKDDDEDLLSKEIIKELMGAGLHSDVQAFVNQADMFRTSVFDLGFSTASKALRYDRLLKELLLYTSKMKQEKDLYTKALTKITEIRGETEVAVSSKGGVYVLRDGKIDLVTVGQLQDGEKALTNAELANLRANSPSMAFNSDIITTLLGATSMKEIRDVVTSALSKLGTMDTKDPMFLSNLEGVPPKLLGIMLAKMNLDPEHLKKLDMNTLLKIEVHNKSNEAQIMLAVQAVLGQMNRSQQTLLAYKAKLLGIQDVGTLVLSFMKQVYTGEQSIDIDTFDMDSGTKGSNKSKNISDMELNAIQMAALGRGVQVDTLLVNGSSTAIHTRGIEVPLQANGKNLEPFRDLMLLQSGDAMNNLDFTNVSVGGQVINPNMLASVVHTDTKGKVVDLPIDIYAKGRGVIKPDLTKATKVEAAMKELNGVDPNTSDGKAKYNLVYRKYGLEEPYDNSGNLRLEAYSRFLVMNGIAKGDAFMNEDEAEMSPFVLEIDSDEVRENFVLLKLKAGYKDYSLSDGWLSKDHLYLSSIYIPFRSSFVAASLGSGQLLTDSQSRQIMALELLQLSNRHENINIVGRVVNSQ